MNEGGGAVLPAGGAGLFGGPVSPDGNDGLQPSGVHRRQRVRRQERQLPAEVRQHARKLHVLVRSRIRTVHRERHRWILHRSFRNRTARRRPLPVIILIYFFFSFTSITSNDQVVIMGHFISNGIKMVSKWYQNGIKMVSDGIKMVSNWYQMDYGHYEGIKMVSNGTKMVPNSIKMVSNGIKMVPKWYQMVSNGSWSLKWY